MSPIPRVTEVVIYAGLGPDTFEPEIRLGFEVAGTGERIVFALSFETAGGLADALAEAAYGMHTLANFVEHLKTQELVPEAALARILDDYRTHSGQFSERSYGG